MFKYKTVESDSDSDSKSWESFCESILNLKNQDI